MMMKLLSVAAAAFCTLCIGQPLSAGVGGGPFVSGLMRGSDGGEVVTGMARFSNGDVVVCGYLPYATAAWDDAPGLDHTFNGGDDAFVAVLDADLATVKAFTLYGGIENDRATAVTIRDDRTILVAGTTRSADLPVSSGSVAPIYSAGVDGFVAAFDRDLSEVQFGTFIVGSGDEHPMNIALDQSGSIYLCGTTTSASGFPTNNGYDRQYEGGTDGFVMRISPNGAAIQFSTYYGSDGYDEIRDMHLDNSGSIYLAGTTHSASFPTFPFVDSRWWWQFRDRPYDWSYNGGLSDAFLLILSEDGAQCIVATYYGGEGEDVATGVVVQDGDVILVGTTNSPNLIVDGGQQAFLNGESDVFLATFDAKGRSMKGATYFGGSGAETVHGAVPGPGNNVLLWGVTTSRDLQVGGYGSRQQILGSEDAFFATLGIGSASLVSAIGGPAQDTLARCLVEPDGSILMAGHTLSRQITLDTGDLRHAGPNGSTNAMVVRYAPGAISLTSPSGSQLRCDGQDLTVSFSRIEMRNDDRYEVQASLDNAVWQTVLGPTSGNSVTWTIDDPAYSGRRVYVRVRSSRRHVTWSPDPIVVDPAPLIVHQPAKAIVACEGAELLLRVEAAGVGLSYQWRYNGKPLTGERSDTLARASVSEADAGAYDVIVTAACGAQVVSQVSTVTVVDEVRITEQPSDLTVTQGKAIVLRCTAMGQNVAYQWYHQATPVTGGTQAVLTIPSATFDDAGEYRCQVTSDCGNVTSDTVEVAVEPTVSVADNDQQGALVWLAGGHPVQDRLLVEATTSDLLIGAYAIYDLAGTLKIQGRGTTAEPRLTVPLNLPNGTYVFVLGTSRLPFIVLRP